MVGRLLRETLIIINVCSIFVQAEDFLELYVPRPEYPIQLNNWLSDVQDHKNDFDSIRNAAIADRRMKKRDLLNLALDAANVEDYLEGLGKQPTNDIYPYMYKTNKKSAKSFDEEPESRRNSFQKTYRSPLRLRRDSYRADLEKINNVDVRSKGSIGEIKRSESKYPERYVRSKSDDNKYANFKRKRDIKIDVLSDGKLLKEIKSDNGGRSVVLNIQSLADTQAPEVPFLNTENSQFNDTSAITDLVREVGNIGKMEKQPVASPGLFRVQGNKETNFRNKNDIVSDKSGEYGIIKQSPAVEKLKESDPNFKNLFNENDKLNTDISMAKDTSFSSTISPIEVTNAANVIRQQQNAANELRKNPQYALKYYTSFANNGLQDMSRFWSPTEKSLMQAGIQIAQGIPDSKSEPEGFEEVTSMVIDSKGNGAVNTNKKYPNKRQLDDFASKILREGYFVKENDVVRQLTDLPVVPNAENIVVNEITVYTNGEIPMATTEKQINSIRETQGGLNTDEFDNREENPKPVDQNNTMHGHEELPKLADGQNDKVSGTLVEQNPLNQSNREMPNSANDQNTIGSNVELAIAPIQHYDGDNIKSTEPQSESGACTHIWRKDKYFIGHQVVTEIETVKELESNMEEGSINTMNVLKSMNDKEKEAEMIPKGIKDELARPISNQEDKECDEEDSQQFGKATNSDDELGSNGEDKQTGSVKASVESNLKHKETFNQRQGITRGKNMENVKESHEKLSNNDHSDNEPKDEENSGHYRSESAKSSFEETRIGNQSNPDTKNIQEDYEVAVDEPKHESQVESHKASDTECNEEDSQQFEQDTLSEAEKQSGSNSEHKQPGTAEESLASSLGYINASASKHEKPPNNDPSEHQLEDKENPGHHRSEAIKGNLGKTPIKSEPKHESQVESEESSEVEPNHGSDESKSMEHIEYPGSIGENTECNDMGLIEHEHFETDEEKSDDNKKYEKIFTENKQENGSPKMDNAEHQNSGIVGETFDNKLDETGQPEESNVEADTGKMNHHDHRVEFEELRKKPTKDHNGGDSLNEPIAYQDSEELDRFGDHHSSHLNENGREEEYDNEKKSEETLHSDNTFEMTECQSEFEENKDNEENDPNRHHHPLKEETDETENYKGDDHDNHHQHGNSEDLEEERNDGKKHRQHDGTQVIIINNGRLKDDIHGIEAKRFLLPQSRRRKKEEMAIKNKRTSKKKNEIAKNVRHSNRQKFVKRRRKKKHHLYRIQADNGRRQMENSGFDYNKHYEGRRLKEADVAAGVESNHHVTTTYGVKKRYKGAVKLESEKFPNEARYMARQLKEIADYVYDPSIEKSEEEYDTNDATEIMDVTEKRQRKIKGAVEGDYGDEEDSMTEKKNGGKKMIKKTKNEFAHPRTTTEAADDDYYYDEIEGMGEGENREDFVRSEKASIGKKARKKVKKLKQVVSSKMHAVKTNQQRTALREPRHSDYSKTNPEFQKWPKFVISDHENEEKLRKRSLAAKKPAKRKKEKFKKSLKDFFLKPAPKKRFDMAGLDFDGNGKNESSSGLESSTDTALVTTTPNECHVDYKATTTSTGVNTTIDGSTACAEEALNTTRPELSTVLSILNQELQSEVEGKSTEMPKLDDILDGRVPSMIRDEILDKVKHNENFKRLQTAIRTSIRTRTSNQTDTNSLETKKMLHYMTQIIERLQFATTCQVLPPSLTNYLRDVTNVPRDDALKRLRDMEEIQLDENQNDPNNNYLFRAHAPMDKLEDKAKLLEELLEKYNKLPDQCKPRAEPVREYIENHLGLVNKMLSGQETSKKSVRRVKDFKRSKPELRKSEDLVEQQLESLGLGKSKTFKAKFDLDELITRHRRQKSILFEDEEENASDKELYDFEKDSRTVSTKYNKLSNAIKQEKKKHKREQTLARVYGEANLDYYNESPKEKREASNYNNFETPLVYSL